MDHIWFEDQTTPSRFTCNLFNLCVGNCKDLHFNGNRRCRSIEDGAAARKPRSNSVRFVEL